MSGEHAEYLDLCAGHALRCLEPDDEKRLLAHLEAGCETCERALAEMSQSVTALALSEAPIATSDAARERLLAAVDALPTEDEPAGAAPVRPWTFPDLEEEPTRTQAMDPLRMPSRWRPVVTWTGWAAAAGLAVALWLQSADLGSAREELEALQSGGNQLLDRVADAERIAVEQARRADELEESVANAQIEIGTLEAALAEEEAWTAALGAPRGRAVRLTPTEGASLEASGYAFYDVDSGRVVLVLEGVDVPSQRDLELWAINDGVPRSLGVVEAGDGLSMARTLAAAEGDVAALAVSLEASGGSTGAGPEGPVILLGAF